MKKTIYCKTVGKGIQSFYVEVDSATYYLFTQKYFVGVRDYFGSGIGVDDLAKACKHHNSAVSRTAEKLTSYLKYAEKEYGIVIFNKIDRRKSKTHQRRRAERASSIDRLIAEYYYDYAA